MDASSAAKRRCRSRSRRRGRSPETEPAWEEEDWKFLADDYYRDQELLLELDILRCEEAVMELQRDRDARAAAAAEAGYSTEEEVHMTLAVVDDMAREKAEAAEQYRVQEEAWLEAHVALCLQAVAQLRGGL